MRRMNFIESMLYTQVMSFNDTDLTTCVARSEEQCYELVEITSKTLFPLNSTCGNLWLCIVARLMAFRANWATKKLPFEWRILSLPFPVRAVCESFVDISQCRLHI